MAAPPGWDVEQALNACPIIALHEVHVWRAHRGKYFPTDYAGSLRSSGRYHRGLDLFSNEPVSYAVVRVWFALYTSLDRDSPQREMERYLGGLSPAEVENYLLTELLVDLAEVIDCSSAG